MRVDAIDHVFMEDCEIFFFLSRRKGEGRGGGQIVSRRITTGCLEGPLYVPLGWGLENAHNYMYLHVLQLVWGSPWQPHTLMIF